MVKFTASPVKTPEKEHEHHGHVSFLQMEVARLRELIHNYESTIRRLCSGNAAETPPPCGQNATLAGGSVSGGRCN